MVDDLFQVMILVVQEMVDLVVEEETGVKIGLDLELLDKETMAVFKVVQNLMEV